MKKVWYALVCVFVTSTIMAQSTYKHAVGASFGNYITYSTNSDHKIAEGVLPGYGFSVGFDHVYRPHGRFALNSRIEYLSFEGRRKVDLRYGNQFTGTGFNPNLPSGEEYEPSKLSDRMGSISATLIPNVYVFNKGKVGVYILAGFSFEMQLHAILNGYRGNGYAVRYFASDQADELSDLIDVGFISGVGFEYAVTEKHIIRIEPTFRMADLTKLGELWSSIRNRRLYTGVNLSYVFAAK